MADQPHTAAPAARPPEGDAGLVGRLNTEVIAPLKQVFVGRDEVVDLIALALTAGEHLFLYGPPGTAKSAVIRRFAAAVRGRYFEYMLTRFSEPNEIFGPVDLGALREGRLVTNITGMLPEAEFVFLDELFNANSAILNNLLTVLNERVYRRGAELHDLPMLSLFSASNGLPDNDALQALFDRFLLRCRVGPLERSAMPVLLTAGWALDSRPAPPASVTAEDLRALARRVSGVDLAAVREPYADLVFRIRDLGIRFSDRRAVKGLRLVAGSAVLCGRSAAVTADLWPLRYVWDREEQIGPLSGLVNRTLERALEGSPQAPAGPTPAVHPLARAGGTVDPEDLARQLDSVESELTAAGPKPTLATLARLRERVTDLSDRTAWLTDPGIRRPLADRATKLLSKLG